MTVERFRALISDNTTRIGKVFFQILISLWGLTLYFFSSSWFLPAGVNKTFVSRSGWYFFYIATFLTVVFSVALKLSKENVSTLKTKEKYSTDNLFLVLLPLTPVMQYILNNREILSFTNALYVFFIFATLTLVFVLLIPALVGRFTSSRILMLFGAAYMFSLTYMAKLSREFTWHEVGSLKIQMAVFLGVFLLAWLFFSIKYEKLLYFLIIASFLSTSLTPFFVKDTVSNTNLEENDNNLVKLVASDKPVITPNIYLLIYDAYVSNATMLSYGIDNQDQEQYLDDLGFKIYPQTYSIGCHSIGTMSRVLNASPNYYGNSRKGVSGDGVVQNLLKGFGYDTYGIFTADFFFRGTTSYYDYSFPSYGSPANILIESIFTGEFRFDIGFDVVPKEQFLEVKDNLFSSVDEIPRFIYMHTKEPGHSQNSGTCLPNETELYYERLKEANLEMNQDLQTILKKDPGAIIIVAGDHGPYLTKNCTYTSFSYNISEISRIDIQDRYGTFLAIKWPSQDYEQYDDIVVLQDVFPAIFAYLFQNQKILDAKVGTMTLDDYDSFFAISEATVVDGIINGGINDGEPLFIGTSE